MALILASSRLAVSLDASGVKGASIRYQLASDTDPTLIRSGQLDIDMGSLGSQIVDLCDRALRLKGVL